MSEFFTCLTFDLDAESAQIRQGDEPSRISKGQFAINKGVPRILALLKEHHIQSTFFVCGWVAEIYPDTINEILSEDHEIAAHGYQHEFLDTLQLKEEKEIHSKTKTILEDLAGTIKGFRAPYWKLSEHTLKIIADMGFLYDSSLMDDDQPYILSIPDTTKTLIEFPVEWFIDDWVMFEHHQYSPSFVLETWISQFDAYLELANISDRMSVYNLTCHPSCIGHAYRLKTLEELIIHMKSKDVAFSRMDSIASFITKNS